MKSANWLFEQSLWNEGRQWVCGIDEVGRGAWAGPVVAAAIIFPKHINFPQNLYDSKLINAVARNDLAKAIHEKAQAVGIGLIKTSIINQRGIALSSQMAFRSAIKELKIEPDFFLVDAFFVKYLAKSKQLPIVKGDQISASIAAASIVAKVFRDQLMTQMHQLHPEYRFDKHKGYGTKLHQEMIREFGFSVEHRTSFNLEWLLNTKVSP